MHEWQVCAAAPAGYAQCNTLFCCNTSQVLTRRARPRYVLLYQLATHQQTLLYYVLINNLEELAPIVYTPTVGVMPCLTLNLP